MNRSIILAGIVTMATILVCYAGIRHELNIAKFQSPPTARVTSTR